MTAASIVLATLSVLAFSSHNTQHGRRYEALSRLASASMDPTVVAPVLAQVLRELQQNTGEHHQCPFNILQQAVRNDLKSIASRDSTALRLSVNQYTDFVDDRSCPMHGRRAASMRLAQIWNHFKQCDNARASLERWIHLLRGRTTMDRRETNVSATIHERYPECNSSNCIDVEANVALASVLTDCYVYDISRPERLEYALDTLNITLSVSPNANLYLRMGVLMSRLGSISSAGDNILKQAANHLELAGNLSSNLITGLKSRNYWQELGMIYARLADFDSMRSVYSRAQQRGAWRSMWQRPLVSVRQGAFNNPAVEKALADLTAKPWWEQNDLPIRTKVSLAEMMTMLIEAASESLDIVRRVVHDLPSEVEQIAVSGLWKELILSDRGNPVNQGCATAPVACKMIQILRETNALSKGRGHQAKLSMINSRGRVVPHTGFSDSRLRIHVPLLVPTSARWFIRAGDPSNQDATRTWEEGNILILDDSFEHEVWCETPSERVSEHCTTTRDCEVYTSSPESEWRVILLIDIWHPDLEAQEKLNLST